MPRLFALERIVPEDALVLEESGTLTRLSTFPWGCRHLTRHPPPMEFPSAQASQRAGPCRLVSWESSGSPSPAHEQPQFNDACPSLPQSSRKSILSRLSHRHHHRMIPVASCDFVFKEKKGTLPLCRVPAAKSISRAVTWTGPRQSRRTHFLGRRRRRVT